MDVGNRIIFDQDGEIVYQTGERTGDVVPHKEITSLSFVDLEFGVVNPQTHRVIGVDVKTNQPILKAVETRTSEQIRINELEDALLLAMDAEMGGIL